MTSPGTQRVSVAESLEPPSQIWVLQRPAVGIMRRQFQASPAATGTCHEVLLPFLSLSLIPPLHRCRPRPHVPVAVVTPGQAGLVEVSGRNHPPRPALLGRFFN